MIPRQSAGLPAPAGPGSTEAADAVDPEADPEAVAQVIVARLTEVITAQARIACAPPDAAVLLDLVAQQARHLVGADGAAIATIDGDDLVYRTSCGILAAQGDLRVQADTSLAGIAARTGTVQVCLDTATDPRVDGSQAQSRGLGSVLFIPLATASRPVGVLGIAWGQPHGPRVGDTDILDMISQIASTRLEHELALRELQDTASRLAHERRLLMSAQQLAQLGSWEWCPTGGAEVATDGGGDLPFTCSSELARILARPEMAGRPLSSLQALAWIHPEDCESFTTNLVTLRETGGRAQMQLRILRPDGEVRYLSGTAEAEQDATGQTTRVWGTAQDVTERVLAERVLARERRRLAEAQQVARMGSWEWDLHSGAVSWSEELFRLHGIDAGRFAGTYNAYLDAIHPDDRAAVDNAWRTVEETGQPASCDYRVLRSDGRIRTFQAYGGAVADADGLPQRIVGTARDVTVERESERQLREALAVNKAITSTTPDIIHIYDLWERRDVLRSIAATRVLGWTGSDLLTVGGDALKAWCHPEDHAQACRDIATASDLADSSTHVSEYRMRTKSGEWRMLSTLWVVFRRDGQGRAEQLLGVTRDVTEARAAERRQQRERRQLAEAQRLAQAGSYELDVVTGELQISDELHRLLGVPAGANISFATLRAMADPQDRSALDRIDEAVTDALRPLPGAATDGAADADDADGFDSTITVDLRVMCNGDLRDLTIRHQTVRDAQGRTQHVWGSIQDISEVRQAQRDTAESEARYRLLADNSSDVVAMMDTDGTLRYVSPSVRNMVGAEAADILGLNANVFVHPADLDSFQEAMTAAATGDAAVTVAHRLNREGAEVWIEQRLSAVRADDGTVLHLQIAARDITERRQAQQELERMALYDGLTGLANRALLADRLRHAIARLVRQPGYVGMLMLDLDRFKLVNDSLGHPVGDTLLVEIAQRLRRTARPSDTVARLGGDEFMILVDGLHDPSEIMRIADRLLWAVNQPFTLPGGSVLHPGGSFGVTVSGDAAKSPDEFYREADLALYRAKDRGRGRIEVYDDSLRGQTERRMAAEQQLRAALAAERLHLAFLQTIDIATDRVVGADALVRISTEDGERLRPDTFLAVAEETGLIVDIDRWVAAKAAEQLAAWDAEGIDVPTLSINVSPRSLASPGYTAHLSTHLTRFGLAGSRLELEVAERSLLDRSLVSDAVLADLRTAGVGIGLDNFGTGHSALSSLQRVELAFVKLDRTVVGELDSDPRAQALCSAVVHLAHALGLTVVAEGVERPAQLQALRTLGCDHAQGHLFGGERSAGQVVTRYDLENPPTS